MTGPDFIIHNGATVQFIPDETVAKGTLLIGQYADNLGRRLQYYEVRHYPTQDVMERVAMIRRIRELVR